MKYYFAPMEGITGYVYRNVHNEIYGGVDKYFMPFVSANHTKKLMRKEEEDLKKDNNKNITSIPQILGNKPDEVNAIIDYIKSVGYDEINLNFGCPSKTVVGKKKGSGIFNDPKLDILKTLMDSVFSREDVVSKELKISVKTRIGYRDKSEWENILKVYRDYPISELIIHPRLQKEFYKGVADRDIFYKYMEKSEFSLCYNGDINTLESFKDFTESLKSYKGEVSSLMIGRGAIRNPNIFNEIRAEDKEINRCEESNTDKKSLLRSFLDKLFISYTEVYKGDKRLAMLKMKEVWSYIKDDFNEPKKVAARILKSKTYEEYLSGVDEIFAIYTLM
ncbi:MAG: tRNA-dihydrouridine synthase family protein [Lachnospiraceae bacterium]|nr:tRNA-dihydrouridine synthase family protein [Lachnospiraceae bacterium]